MISREYCSNTSQYFCYFIPKYTVKHYEKTTKFHRKNDVARFMKKIVSIVFASGIDFPNFRLY